MLVGEGLFLGFDVYRGAAEANKLVNYLKSKGILVGLCGETTIGLRPTLTLEPTHVAPFIKALRSYPYLQTIHPL